MKRPIIFITICCIVFASLCLLSCDPNASLENANIALVEKTIAEIYNNRNMELIPELISKDAVRYNNEEKAEIIGHEGVKGNVEWNLRFAPDFQLTTHDIFASGEKVVARWTYSGTNKQFNKKVSFDGASIFYCKDGKITAEWRMWDEQHVSAQLGFVITPPQAKD